MTIPFTHPNAVELETLLSETTDPGTREVGGHVASCPRCQDELRSLRALRVALKHLPAPRMSTHLWKAVEYRLTVGDRVILPALSPQRLPRFRAWPTIVPIAAALVLVVFLATRRGDPLEAAGTAGDLTILAGTPSAPNRLSITYRPELPLAAADSLILRAKVFFPGRAFTPSEQEFGLRRRGEVFTGEVMLPSKAALSKFSVSSIDGQHADDNDARAWEFVARDSANRPTFDGLRMQNIIHGMDDWERSYTAAQEMVRLYPERPEGVAALFNASKALAGAGKADSVALAFRPRVEAMNARYANVRTDAGVMWQMVMLSNEVGDTGIARSWFDRMQREYPRDAGTIQLRVFDVFNSPISDVERLGKLDALWDETGGNSPQLLANAFQLADKLGDQAAVERWGDRQATLMGSGAAVAVTFVRYERLRAKGETLLREALAAMPPLSQTNWQLAMRSNPGLSTVQGQWQLSALGDALLRDGNAAGAIDTLRRAAALAWDPTTLRSLGDAALALQDTDEAVQAYAWIVADRRTSSARSDTLRARLGRAAESEIFTRARAEGEASLHAAALASTYRRSLARAATYADDAGSRHSLSDALGTGLSVIAVVSTNCAPSLADLPALQRLRTHLSALGIPMLTFVEETPNAAASHKLAGRGFSGAIAFDDRAEVSRALRQYGTPDYFIVEGGKTVRADSRRADDLLDVIVALKP